MPRPSRTKEAKVAIRGYYAEHGVMPTVEGFAEVMGYKSTSSAHHTIMALVTEGYLAQEKRGGRLLPGASFVRAGRMPTRSNALTTIPSEIAASLPGGVQLNVLEVPDDSLKEHAICAGDMLVVVDLNRTDLSDLVLQSRGMALALSTHRKSGWRALGLLVAQYRQYGPRSSSSY
jgi:SOS-response transcriptional repressor LexA